MSGFSIDWLDLREGADRRARADKLLEQARHWLQSDAAGESEIRVVDLGAGTGSTLRAFATGCSAQESLSWHLVDQDAQLLAQARLRHGDAHQLQTHELDLTDIAALAVGRRQADYCLGVVRSGVRRFYRKAGRRDGPLL